MRANNKPDPAFDPFDLTGKVALVTGGSRGIGRGVALCLAKAGADVAVTSRKQERCDEVAAEIRALGRRALGCACHVARWDEIEELVETIYAEFGRVDALVNNAGISPLYPSPHDVSEEYWDKVLGVNLKGPFRLTALVGERMKSGGGGSVINVSSMGAVRPSREVIPYAAAKAGLNAMTIGFADALGPAVRVNAVMPGPIRTDIARNWDQEAFARRARTFPLRRVGEIDEVVGAVHYFASDASTYTTGAVLAVDGGAQWSFAGGGDEAVTAPGGSVFHGEEVRG